MGPPTILSEEEEEDLVKWITNTVKQNIPVTRDLITSTVAKLIEEKKRETPFRRNKPGVHWFRAFLKRQPALKEVRVGSARSLIVIQDKPMDKKMDDVSDSKLLTSSSCKLQQPATYFSPEHFRIFESFIPAQRLQEFRNSGDNWTGLEAAKELFHLWTILKSYVEESLSTSVNPSSDEFVVSEKAEVESEDFAFVDVSYIKVEADDYDHIEGSEDIVNITEDVGYVDNVHSND